MRSLLPTWKSAWVNPVPKPDGTAIGFLTAARIARLYFLALVIDKTANSLGMTNKTGLEAIVL